MDLLENCGGQVWQTMFWLLLKTASKLDKIGMSEHGIPLNPLVNNFVTYLHSVFLRPIFSNMAHMFPTGHWPLYSVAARAHTHIHAGNLARKSLGRTGWTSKSGPVWSDLGCDLQGIWEMQLGLKPDTVMVIASISWDMTPMNMYFVYIYINMYTIVTWHG